MYQQIPVMLPIREAANQTGLSYDFIRKLCLEDRIVYVRAGKKFLINMDMFVDYLNGKDSTGDREA